MRISGKSVLLTGAGSGLGRDLVVALTQKGCIVTAVDVDLAAAEATVRLCAGNAGKAWPVQCDVTNDAAQETVFKNHIKKHNGVDIAILNAGVYERGDFVDSDGPGWKATLNINLVAALVGARIAARAMTSSGKPGAILFMASAGGLFPMPIAPVYAASKAALVHFVRSAAPKLARRGVRMCAVCPQPVDTPMVQTMVAAGLELPETGASLLTPAKVSEATIMLLEDDKAAGRLLMVHVNGKFYTWKPPGFRKSLVPVGAAAAPAGAQTPEAAAGRAARASWASDAIPIEGRKLQVHRLSTDFRAATRIVAERVPPPAELPPGAPLDVHRVYFWPLGGCCPSWDIYDGHILVRRAYAAINASDINYTAGRYFGSAAEAEKRLPFDAGFEAVGVVAAAGTGVEGFAVGDAVAQMTYGAFSEWGVVLARHALPVPAVAPEIVALLTSGLTASIGLEEAGRLRRGETVLVTAAAGGTGQFAVQLAVAAGCRVVATCGGAAKAALLRRLGAERVINYREERVKDVLKQEFPKGVDVVWEAVGGEMLATGVHALARGGRLVVIGAVSQYATGWAPSALPPGTPELLLWRSATITGAAPCFFLLHYTHLYRKHLQRLVAAWRSGRLHVALDPTPFWGLEAVAEAEDLLLSGRSVGKIVVQLAAEAPPRSDSPAAKL